MGRSSTTRRRTRRTRRRLSDLRPAARSVRWTGARTRKPTSSLPLTQSWTLSRFERRPEIRSFSPSTWAKSGFWVRRGFFKGSLCSATEEEPSRRSASCHFWCVVCPFRWSVITPWWRRTRSCSTGGAEQSTLLSSNRLGRVWLSLG